MKCFRLIFFISIIFFSCSESGDSEQPEPELIFEGHVILTTQQEVDEFGANGYTHITGELRVFNDINNTADPSVSNLDALIKLRVVGKGIQICNNKLLKNLDGLKNLVSINGNIGLRIHNNEELENINGLNKLEIIEDRLSISGNSKLISINGFNNLKVTDHFLTISHNDMLTVVKGFESLESTKGSFSIRNNPNLSSINAFSKLASVKEDFSVTSNNSLKSIIGFSNLETVDGRLMISTNGLESVAFLRGLKSVGNDLDISFNKITNLSGLEDLNAIVALPLGSPPESTTISIIGNEQLKDFCQLKPFVNNGYVGNFNVSQNMFNPTKQDVIDGNCSQ